MENPGCFGREQGRVGMWGEGRGGEHKENNSCEEAGSGRNFLVAVVQFNKLMESVGNG